MARRKSEKDRRSEFVMVRMNDEEKMRAKRVAKRYGMTLSEWIRQVLRKAWGNG